MPNGRTAANFHCAGTSAQAIPEASGLNFFSPASCKALAREDLTPRLPFPPACDLQTPDADGCSSGNGALSTAAD